MQFNNYFNLRRFTHLFRQDFLINKAKYLLSIIGLGLVTYLLSYWFFTSNVNVDYRVCFIFYMMAVGVVVGTAFPDLNDNIKTSQYLLSPGSTLEKLMVQFFLRIGLFIPVALGVFWIAVRLAKASLLADPLTGFDPASIPYFEFRFIVTGGGNQIWDTWQILCMVFGFLSYGCYLFSGTTYFRQYALIKTIIASGILLVISILFSIALSHIFYPQESHGFNMSLESFVITQHLNSSQLFALVLSLFTWVFFLCISYFKLKEKEA